MVKRKLAKRAVVVEGGTRVTSVTYPALGLPRSSRSPPAPVLVLAHGAGADQEHAFMVDAATRLSRAGVETITFNFPYTEAGRKLPDPPMVLQRCFRAVIADVRSLEGRSRLFIGGKSLGGRMASHIAADRDPDIAGLVCLGYPLHPPGKPERLRTEHLVDIRVPVLIVQGTRDPFGGPDEIRAQLHAMAAPVTIFSVDQGDHSFKVPKRVAGADVVMQGVIREIVRWMAHSNL